MRSGTGRISRPVNRRRSGIRLASVPPQRVAQNVTARQQWVLAVLSTSPEGMALRDLRKRIEQITVADHDGKGSVFRRLKADDYRMWLENFSVGELWEKNVLGGRP